FVSTVPRNAWNGTSVYNAYHEHPLVTIDLAKSLKIPYLDLNAASTALMESAGEEFSTYFLYLNIPVGEFSTVTTAKADNVHFQAYGAQEMARLIASLIEAQKATAPMTQLAAALKPRVQVTITGRSDAGLVTQSNAYPAGFKLMLRARPNSTHRFLRWQDAAGTTLSTQAIYTYTVPNSASSVTAVFN
ncbi:MAG TPA: SGNH/GDSL hydrolase family protein, partial [Cellvibrionaceae bacterium]|nr:SGNH/GDSL hydrolase family protein [Cellvibrionaceae bacterium]